MALDEGYRLRIGVANWVGQELQETDEAIKKQGYQHGHQNFRNNQGLRNCWQRVHSTSPGVPLPSLYNCGNCIKNIWCCETTCDCPRHDRTPYIAHDKFFHTADIDRLLLWPFSSHMPDIPRHQTIVVQCPGRATLQSVLGLHVRSPLQLPSSLSVWGSVTASLAQLAESLFRAVSPWELPMWFFRISSQFCI